MVFPSPYHCYQLALYEDASGQFICMFMSKLDRVINPPLGLYHERCEEVSYLHSKIKFGVRIIILEREE